MRGRSGSAALFFLALAIQVFFTPRAMAFEKTVLLDGIEYRFICTDVAQLKEKINVLVILSRPAGAGGAKQAIRVSHGIPIGAFTPSAGPARHVPLQAPTCIGLPHHPSRTGIFERPPHSRDYWSTIRLHH